jgi:integrase
LSGIAEDYSSRNLQRLDDDEVRRVVAAAYEIDSAFGLYVEVHAQTGARSSQIARLTVADLLNNPWRLNMPVSRKGKGRKPSKRAVPITESLALEARQQPAVRGAAVAACRWKALAVVAGRRSRRPVPHGGRTRWRGRDDLCLAA